VLAVYIGPISGAIRTTRRDLAQTLTPLCEPRYTYKTTHGEARIFICTWATRQGTPLVGQGGRRIPPRTVAPHTLARAWVCPALPTLNRKPPCRQTWGVPDSVQGARRACRCVARAQAGPPTAAAGALKRPQACPGP